MALGWNLLGSPVSSSSTALAAETLPTRLPQPAGRHHAHQHRITTNGQASTSGDSSSRNLSSRGKSSTRAWQHQWRYMRSEKERANRNLPKVDWNRYHLQILFVDRTDTVRARVAAGLLERIAEWNGYGRALYPYACGVEARQELDWSTSAALMGMAGMLGIRAKLFAAQPEQLVYEDFDRCDLLVAMDDELLEQALSIAGSEKDQAWYAPRCTTLTAFAPYCGTALLNPGGNGVLEPELRQIVAPVITRAQAAHGIARPDLRTGSAEWNSMVEDTVVSCAGLVQYLADQWPPELQEGWLQY
ncbi:hypothetical protein CVIRNUC_010570 [Coccomyxa viridis]|uniref:Phosphotyrosine protein phosphatase I domain-containing protein n=1 Tax=Coccomyxa viridis TaxID=1274662 RepID=A0AAV1IM76_9CHLO|nr:hypothetical protein CVIRNUC_010570 [Coccomyxa viridis]